MVLDLPENDKTHGYSTGHACLCRIKGTDGVRKAVAARVNCDSDCTWCKDAGVGGRRRRNESTRVY